MSPPGFMQKIRKNPDFIHCTRELDRLGIEWSVRPPMGRGHPYLEVQGYRRPLSSSPNGYMGTGRVVAQLRKWLRERNLLKEETKCSTGS